MSVSSRVTDWLVGVTTVGTDERLIGAGAGLGVTDPLLSLSAVTTAGTLTVPVSLPLPSSTPGTARPELSPLTPA